MSDSKNRNCEGQMPKGRIGRYNMIWMYTFDYFLNALALHELLDIFPITH